MKPVVREARAGDEALLYRFICELEKAELPREAFAGVWMQCMADRTVKYLIAERGEIPVGIGSCYLRPLLHHAGLVAEIQELYVEASERSQGVGALLLEKLVEFARESGALQVEVASGKHRKDAHRFYEREGFVNSHFKLVRKLENAASGE